MQPEDPKVPMVEADWCRGCGTPSCRDRARAHRAGWSRRQNEAHSRRQLALAAERLFEGTIQLSLCLGFPRRPLSAGANRRNRPKATDAAHAFDRRPLFLKHLTAARLAEL